MVLRARNNIPGHSMAKSALNKTTNKNQGQGQHSIKFYGTYRESLSTKIWIPQFSPKFTFMFFYKLSCCNGLCFNILQRYRNGCNLIDCRHKINFLWVESKNPWLNSSYPCAARGSSSSRKSLLNWQKILSDSQI